MNTYSNNTSLTLFQQDGNNKNTYQLIKLYKIKKNRINFIIVRKKYNYTLCFNQIFFVKLNYLPYAKA